jgi:hypothetical protein
MPFECSEEGALSSKTGRDALGDSGLVHRSDREGPRRRRRPRDNAWLARLDLDTDLLYDARGRTRELRPLDL